MPIAKFKLGQVTVTPNLLEKVNKVDQMRALNHHARCDWGIIPDEDKFKENLTFKREGKPSRKRSGYPRCDHIDYNVIECYYHWTYYDD